MRLMAGPDESKPPPRDDARPPTLRADEPASSQTLTMRVDETVQTYPLGVRTEEATAGHTRPTPPSPPPPPPPTAADVLRWIAASGDEPWFPSRHARTTGLDRNSLDEPLNLLRTSGYIRVATWVRGLGQGYVLTPEGQAALANGLGLAATPEPDLPPLPFSPNPRLPAEFERQLAREPHAAFAVPLLLMANVLWFFVGIVAVVRGGYPLGRYLSDGHPYLLHRLGAVTGSDLQGGEWWRLVTACFVHIGLLHLLVNLLALAMMGPLVELLWGRWRFLVVYAVSGLAGSCLAMANRPDTLLAGASGAIWGLLASLAAWLVLHRQQLEAEVSADWTRRLWVVLLLNVGISLLPGISWEAHLGGGLAGFLTAWLLSAVRPGDRLRNLSVVTLLLLLPVVCVGGLLAVMTWGEPWQPLRQRAAAHAKRQTIEAAREAFLREVLPRLTELSPEVLRPLDQQVGLLAIRPRPRRNAETVAETRARLTELKATAETILRLLPPEPVGLESFDRHRAKVREFATARLKQVESSLALLEAPEVPSSAAWQDWGRARRDADELWEALGTR